MLLVHVTIMCLGILEVNEFKLFLFVHGFSAFSTFVTQLYVVVGLFTVGIVVFASEVHSRMIFGLSLVTQKNAREKKGFTPKITFAIARPDSETIQVIFVADGAETRRGKRKCSKVCGSSRR